MTPLTGEWSLPLARSRHPLDCAQEVAEVVSVGVAEGVDETAYQLVQREVRLGVVMTDAVDESQRDSPVAVRRSGGPRRGLMKCSSCWSSGSFTTWR